jgi:periplasmic divalent cation tolerance protein
VCVVLVTGPDREALTALGRRLVEERLAACVNVLGDVRSIYRWEGAVEEAAEALALLKTTGTRLEALTARVRELHPYEEPEVVALPVVGGSASYLAWVAAGVR